MQKQSGFTLVELMIVIAIIGILAAALFPSYSAYITRSKNAAIQSDLRTLSIGILRLYADTGKSVGGCPMNSVANPEYMITEPTAGLVARPTDFTDRWGCQWSPDSGWAGPYLDKLPIDPYGSYYWFDPDYGVCNTSTNIDDWIPVILSIGPNKLINYPSCASGAITDDSYYKMNQL